MSLLHKATISPH